MLESPLEPYLLWAKTREPAAIDLAGSNLVPCSLADLPDAREALDIVARNDNGYGPLVEAIAGHYGIDPSRVVSGAGCSGANFLTIAALVGPGDDVLVERPVYDPLVGACRLMGATVRRFDRAAEGGFDIDPVTVEAAITPRTRLVIVTNPHNPSGRRVDPDVLVRLGGIMTGRGWVLVDEVYLDVANRVAGRRPTAGSAVGLEGPFVVTSSLTKSYGLAGLKCGWAIASTTGAERIRRARDVVENAGSVPSDLLSAHAFTFIERLGDRARAIVGRNLELAGVFMSRQRDLRLSAPLGSSVMFPALPAATDADDFAERLLDRHGVAVAPGGFFGAPGHIRLSLAAHPAVVEAGLDRIGRFLER